MKKYLYLTTLLLVILTVLSCTNNVDKTKFITFCEQSNFERTPGYDQTIDYCNLLASSSNKINLLSIGTSPQGRDIPLLIVDKDGLTSVKKIRSKGRAIVLAEACIHAGEPDGKDGGLMFIRDLALYDEYPGLLDNVTFLFIPILNVDGHEDFGEHYRINQNGPVEVGARFTAQRLNMNRDFIKADAPEMRAFLKLYNEWNPEVFIDIHVTNGADFQYVSTYGLDQCGFLTSNMLEWSKNCFEKELLSKMKEDGYPIFPYFSTRNIPGKGITVFPSNFPPQYSNGYASANNRIGLLVENHIYKPYKERVIASYLYLKNSMQIVSDNKDALMQEIAKADATLSSESFIKDSLPLSFVEDFTSTAEIEYLGWKDIEEKSDLSGAIWRYSDRNSPVTYKYHYVNSYKEALKVQLPKQYIIPSEHLDVIELLDIHGIKYSRLEEDTEIRVESYIFNKSKWSEVPYEGRITLNAQYDTKNETIQYHQGDVIVNTAQPKLKVIAHLLEPLSPTSLLYWGFFNSFVRAPSEFYIRLNYMEVKGREMLEKDPAIRAEFEMLKATDKKFANDPNAILSFFMKKVRESVEVGVNRYPVGRVL